MNGPTFIPGEDDRRCMVLNLSPEEVLTCLLDYRKYTKDVLATHENYTFVFRSWKVPAGTKVKAVHFDIGINCFRFFLTNPAFKEIQPGEYPPTLESFDYTYRVPVEKVGEIR